MRRDSKLCLWAILLVTGLSSAQSFADVVDVARLEIDKKYAADGIFDYLKETYGEKNSDVFNLARMPDLSEKSGSVIYHQLGGSDTQSDGHTCTVAFQQGGAAMEKNQYYRLTRAILVAKKLNGEKKLFVKVDFLEQNKSATPQGDTYTAKPDGAGFSYSCIIDWDQLDGYSYGYFFAGIENYLDTETLKNYPKLTPLKK